MWACKLFIVLTGGNHSAVTDKQTNNTILTNLENWTIEQSYGKTIRYDKTLENANKYKDLDKDKELQILAMTRA